MWLTGSQLVNIIWKQFNQIVQNANMRFAFQLQAPALMAASIIHVMLFDNLYMLFVLRWK
jgi:hypothetical protein